MLYSFEIHASSSGPRLSSTSVPSRSALSPITLKWELNESICEREWYSGIHRPVSDWADASESLESCAVARRFEKMAYLSNTIGVFWLKCRGWSVDNVPDSSCLGLMTAMIALVRSSGYFHSCPPSDSFSSRASPALIWMAV